MSKKNYILIFVILLSATIIWLVYQSANFSQYYRSYTFSADETSLYNPDKYEPKYCINDSVKFEYSKRYPSIKQCNVNYNVWTFEKTQDEAPGSFNYARVAPVSFQTALRISRAILVFFPLDRYSDFILELKWLYRSWIEMMRSEPEMWRTDLVIFLDNDPKYKEQIAKFNEIGCSFNNTRKNKLDKPMCTLLACKAIKNRVFEPRSNEKHFRDTSEYYSFLLNKLDIFNDSADNLRPFYKELTPKLKHYGNIDSIIVAFDGYSYLKNAQFDFVMKTDMDVFLTPLFGKWIPRFCNDFYAGNGGYSTIFNLKRLKGAAKDLNLEHASEMNIGSTWFGTPDQFRIVSYLTLFSMLYLSEEEFSPTEREGKFGVDHWPYWHYGVLSMYGSDMAVNHFMATKEFHIVKLPELFDFPTVNIQNINHKLHIHVFHTDEMFSKFQFKAGKYDSMVSNNENFDTNQVKYYCLKMALEGKFIPPADLYKLFLVESDKKK